jgi:hypothetical protein
MDTSNRPQPSKLSPEADELQAMLCRLAGQAVVNHGMIADGDTGDGVSSGGKDEESAEL